jgi:signal transduction histidine kinase
MCSWEMKLEHKGKKTLLINSKHIEGRMIMIISDVTKLKELEEHYQLSKSFTLIGEISSSFAHQIKNLLLPLKLLMQQKGDLTPKDIEVIHSLISKINNIIGEFLSIGEKIDTNLNTLFPAQEVVSKVSFILSGSMRAKNIQLELEINNSLCLDMDYTVFENIVTELLSNAIAASYDQGAIRILFSKENENFGKFIIQDNGIGIKEDVQEHIFDPFFTTKKEGNGLGLFNIYKMVYLYKGRIELISHSGFTEFTLLLPIAKDKKCE